MSARMLFATVLLRMQEEWAVAAPEQASLAGAARPVARDAEGNVYVPPSSVAGALRDHLRGCLADPDGPNHDSVEGWMGHVGERGTDESASASRIWVLGTAVATDGSAPKVHTRKRTAMDPVRGAAATSTLREEHVVESGATVTVYLRVDLDAPGADDTDGAGSDDDGARALIDRLATWAPILGGGRTSGRGRAGVTEVRFGRIDLSNPDDLTLWLSTGGPELVNAIAKESVDVQAPARATQSFRLKVVDPVRFGADGDGNIQGLRLAGGKPVVDGSSIRGVLRHRAGFILRSLGIDACTAVDGCGTCALCALFGSKARRSRIAVGSSAFHDDAKRIKVAHVSIDRFTGGAAEHRLFGEEAVGSGTFELRLEDLGAADLRGAKELLEMVLADVDAGFVGFGAGTARGNGTVQVLDERGQRWAAGPMSELAGSVIEGAPHWAEATGGTAQ